MTMYIRAGHITGGGKGREYPVAASQYFARRGGKFCYLTAGDITACATGTNAIMGWAQTPKDATSKNAWKSSGTASNDKIFVITGLEDEFVLPVNEGNASIAASHIGKGAGLVNAGSNATYAVMQEAKIGKGSSCGLQASPVVITDVDVINKMVKVKIKVTSRQSYA